MVSYLMANNRDLPFSLQDMRRAICQSAPLAALSVSHSLPRLWPIHHTLILVAEIHYKRYVWVTASAGMRFSSGNCELIKIPFVNIEVA